MKQSPGAVLWQAAMMRACSDFPYIGLALAALHPVESPGLGTCAVDDHWRVYYDPEALARWSASERGAVARHEVEHLLRDHAGRCGSRVHAIWALDCDREINTPELAARLPKGCLRPSQIGADEGLLAEQYYDIECDLAKKGSDKGQGQPGASAQGQEGKAAGQEGGQAAGLDPPAGSPQSGPSENAQEGQPGGSGPSSAAGDDSPASDGSAGDGSRATGTSGGAGQLQPDQRPVPRGEDAPAAGSDPGSARASQPVHGSGVDGIRRPWELDPSHPSGIGPVDARLIREAVAREINAAVARGTQAGSLARWAHGLLAPAKVDWRTELAALMRGELRAAGAQDYTYSRPSRRQVAGIVLPAMRSRRPQVVLVTDVSGSIGDPELAQARSEVRGVAQAVGGEAQEVVCDAAVQDVRRATGTGDYVGGGGTDMGVGIERAARQRPAPDVIVVLTDGHTPWPESRPRAHLIVVLLGSGRAAKSSVPDWAKVVEVES